MVAPAADTEAPEAQAEDGGVLDLTSPGQDFVEVVVPYEGREYICPNCERPISTKRQINFAKPARFAHRLNDVMKCPEKDCQFIFSYRLVTVRVLSR